MDINIQRIMGSSLAESFSFFSGIYITVIKVSKDKNFAVFRGIRLCIFH